MKQIKRRDESKYSLALSSHRNIPQNKMVGQFYYEGDEGFRFYIILDDEIVKSSRHRAMAVGIRFDKNENEVGVVYITKEMLTKLQSKPFYLSALWHELGHYHNGDFHTRDIPNDIATIRKQHLQNNKVMDVELKADEFACRRLGKRNIIRFLESTIEERKRYNDNNSDLAVKEFNLRIEHIKKYQPNQQ